MKHKSIAATILALGFMISNAGIVSAHNDNFTAKKYSGIQWIFKLEFFTGKNYECNRRRSK